MRYHRRGRACHLHFNGCFPAPGELGFVGISLVCFLHTFCLRTMGSGHHRPHVLSPSQQYQSTDHNQKNYYWPHSFFIHHWTPCRVYCLFNVNILEKVTETRMWANAERDGRPAKYRWRPLFNFAKFCWRPVLECHAVMLPRREIRWN